MIENATNLTSTTNLANSIDIKLAVAIISSVLVGVGLFLKLKGWHTAKEANEIAKEANRISEEANETSKNIQKKQHEHEKEMERLRQEHDKQVAKEQITRHLKQFIRTEEMELSKIDDWHQEKIAEVGNDLKETLKIIDENKILFSKNILEELLLLRDKMRDLSEIRLFPSKAHRLNLDFENIQISSRKEKGEKLIKEARNLIKKFE